MKRIIFFAILLSTLTLGLYPGTSEAKRHHKRHRVTHTRVVYAHPRAHGVNANVGVGVGPIHIGAGAGVGVHEAAPPPSDLPNDLPQNQNDSYWYPPVDNGRYNVVATAAAVREDSPVTSSLVRNVASEDRDASDYYYDYVPPKTVTVGGFSVPVKENSRYYNPFKHRNGEPMQVHNWKGLDETAGYGVSPRAGSLPTCFGVAYTATAIPEQ